MRAGLAPRIGRVPVLATWLKNRALIQSFGHLAETDEITPKEDRGEGGWRWRQPRGFGWLREPGDGVSGWAWKDAPAGTKVSA
jgi:hypothetical protein